MNERTDERTDRVRAWPAGSRWIRVAWVVLGVIAVAVAVLAITGGGGGNSKGGGGALLQTYEVPSKAMLPGLAAGSKVEVDQNAYADSEPRVGDVVAVHPPAGAGRKACGTSPNPGEPCPRPASGEANRIVIERVVAGPGDTVSIKDGAVVVDGTAESETAKTRACGGGATCELPRAIQLGAGQYFLLGDNRQASDDSRSWGPVPAGWIIGKVE